MNQDPPHMSQATASRLQTEFWERFPTSAKLAERARNVFPNGVTHDSRYLTPFPVSVSHAQGASKWDVDGNEILDYWMGHGALLLGHSPESVVTSVQQQIQRGTHYGACHELEIQWGELVQCLIPSAERVRFTSSGTEATLMALRVARIVTGRTRVVKFAGHFHGWHDWLIPGADPPYGPQDSSTPGIPDKTLEDLVIIPPNDLELVDQTLAQTKPAALILEATGGHWGMVPMNGEFLKGLREITNKHKTLLIFDEVITGFRVSPGGSQAYYQVTPDLTTLAKVLAGGLPGGALAGKTEYMQALEFENPYGKKMRHPGTYNGNPLSAAAGCAALNEVAKGIPCETANQRAKQLRIGLNQMFEEKGVNWICYGDFSWATIVPEYEGPRPDSDRFVPYHNELMKLDRKIDRTLSHAFRCALLLNGVDFFGWRAMLSSAHGEKQIHETVQGISRAIDLLRGEGLVP